MYTYICSCECGVPVEATRSWSRHAHSLKVKPNARARIQDELGRVRRTPEFLTSLASILSTLQSLPLFISPFFSLSLYSSSSLSTYIHWEPRGKTIGTFKALILNGRSARDLVLLTGNIIKCLSSLHYHTIIIHTTLSMIFIFLLSNKFPYTLTYIY